MPGDDAYISPQVLNAFMHDSYDAGDSDITGTQIIDSPRIMQLKKAHQDDIERTLPKVFFSVMGRGVHAVMESATSGDDTIAEERIFWDHPNGLRTSTQLDLQILNPDGTVIVVDYKVTSVRSVLFAAKHEENGIKPEWDRQLQVQKFFVEKAKGMQVTELYILVILRDWIASQAKTRADYPQSPVLQLPVPMWESDTIAGYVEERLALHQQASYAALLHQDLVECSDAEMWAQSDKFVVLKSATAKRASKVCSSMDEAIAWAADNKLNGDHIIQHRLGKRTRCEDYCEVNRWCSQYTRYVESQSHADA